MRDILENEETFTASATIAAGYYMLSEASKEMVKFGKLSPIELMVDAVTGHGTALLQKGLAEMELILIDIIEAKKVLEDDYSEDNKMLEEIRKRKK